MGKTIHPVSCSRDINLSVSSSLLPCNSQNTSRSSSGKIIISREKR